MFRRTGNRVTVLDSAEQVLPHEGADVARELQQALRAEGPRRAGAPYTLLKAAVCIHPTLAEGFRSPMEAVKPVD